VYIFRAGGVGTGACDLTVTDISSWVDAATYFYAKKVELTADYTLGKVPPFTVEFTTLDVTTNLVVHYTESDANGAYNSAADINFMFCYVTTTDRDPTGGVPGAVPEDCDSPSVFSSTHNDYPMQIGTPTTSGDYEQVAINTAFSAYVLVEGEQPDGDFTLTYTCESSVADIFALTDVTALSANSITVKAPAQDTFESYGTLYLEQGSTSAYVMIDHGSTSCSVSSCSATFTPSLPTNFDYSDLASVSGEFGVFFSDPDADNGVSAACMSQRTATTDAISPFDTATDVRSKLRSLSNYISDVTVTRSHTIATSGSYTTNAGDHVSTTYLQYEWQITFITNNGDVNPLTATSSLTSTTTVTPSYTPEVKIDTTTIGGFIMGDFGLQANYPHIFETTDGLVSLLPVDDDVPTD
jgi:hypothetical protein